MARPVKCRKVCEMPFVNEFAPCGRHKPKGAKICMTVDEYETIRLIDYEGYSQEECAGQMHVGRTTVQSIYARARQKLSRLLVDGNPLVIGGGDYKICGKKEKGCGDCPQKNCTCRQL